MVIAALFVAWIVAPSGTPTGRGRGRRVTTSRAGRRGRRNAPSPFRSIYRMDRSGRPRADGFVRYIGPQGA